MIAIGEVGLPYYTRQQYATQGQFLKTGAYVDLIDRFIRLAKKMQKPIVLHAVHEDAEYPAFL